MHTTSLSLLDSIAEMFSAFHDGSIIEAKQEAQTLLLTIDIEYLAERLQPDFDRFFVHLHKVQTASFKAWSAQSKTSAPPEQWTEHERIFSHDLELLSAKRENNEVKIFCRFDDYQGNAGYGEWMLSTRPDAYIALYAQDQRPLVLDDLYQLHELAYATTHHKSQSSQGDPP